MIECPLVSAIVPVYNSERFLREAIDSILGQSYRPIQIVAVNDGSTDSSRSILESYGEQVEVHSQSNAGVAAARNEGISRARGKFIAFLDADDLWHADKIRIQVEYLQEHQEVGAVYANLLIADQSQSDEMERLIKSRISEPFTTEATGTGWLYTRLLRESFLHTSSVMMRKSLIDEIGLFDRSLTLGEDYDYWIRASRLSEIHRLDSKLSVYRMHEEGITKRPPDKNYGALVIESAVERWGRTGPDGSKASIRDVNNRLSTMWFDFAYLHEQAGDSEIAAKGYLKAIRLTPWNVRAVAKYVQCSLRKSVSA